MRLIFFAIYLGIGAVFHAMVLGPQFDWSNARTFGWLFGWPLMLLIWFWAIGLVVMIVTGLCLAGYAWLQTIAEWRAKRRRKSNRQHRSV